jgi:hypothetical protein
LSEGRDLVGRGRGGLDWGWVNPQRQHNQRGNQEQATSHDKTHLL